MENYLRRNFNLFAKKISFLVLILALGTGIAFSAEITVASEDDAGAGSLRQAVADAVDGDMIVFADTVKTILLGLPLELGDKSLTIDGSVVLDGRLLGDEALDTNRVITVTGVAGKTVKLMNLTIQYGYAKDTVWGADPSGDNGGGMLVDNRTGGELIARGLTFMMNKSQGKGGGLYAIGLSSFDDCDFMSNSALDADQGDGGGAATDTLVTVDSCSFSMNMAADHGGGLYAMDPTSIVSSSSFEANEAGDDGGGVYLSYGQAMDLEISNNSAADKAGGMYMSRGMAMGLTVTNNTAIGDHAGGVYIDNESVLKNSVLTGNKCEDDGGAVYVDDSSGVIQDCYIANNEAVDHAGGIYINSGYAINCIIDNNISGDDGGGAYIDNQDYAGHIPGGYLISCVISNNKCVDSGGGLSLNSGKVINCTFTGNFGKNGGGIRAQTGAWLVVNSIIHGNDASDSRKNIRYESNLNTVGFDYCVIDTNSNANRDLTPENSTNMIILADSPFIGGMGANALQLPGGSSLIDAGLHTDLEAYFPAMDALGNDRVINSVIDIGAYEALQGTGLVVLNELDSGAGSLRDIVAGASDGDTVTFDAAVSTIKLDMPLMLGDKTLTIDGMGSAANVVLDGGFNGDANLDTNRVITVIGEMGRIVTLKNLTIQNGNAEDSTSAASDPNNQGGGLYANTGDANHTSLIVEDVVFQNNTAWGRGGGVFSTGPNLFLNSSFLMNKSIEATAEGRGGGAAGYYSIFEACTFKNNWAGYKAGGIMNHNGNLTNNCVIDSNYAADDGGGAILEEYSWITNSSFTGNECGVDDGGAIYCNKGYMDGLTVTGNKSGDHAGGIYLNNDSKVTNSTFIDNYAGDDGGAIYIDDSTGWAENCVITGNESFDHGGGAFINSGYIVNSLVDGNVSGDDGGGVHSDDNYTYGANIIGCIISNNSAVDQGGGIYMLNGNIVNTQVVNNKASGSGNGFRGKGTWKIVNSIFWGNDVSNNTNTEAVMIAYSAVDNAAGTNIDAAAMLNVALLTESPFVGGTGADSLRISNVSLMDAGSVDVALVAVAGLVSDVLPATDIDGDPRIQGVIDMGAYETERPLIAVTGVSLDKNALSLYVAETGALVATVAPADATDNSVSWSTADALKATVDNGTVTGVAEGDVYIYVTTTDGGFMDSCLVTVSVGTSPVTGVSLDQHTLSVNVGATGVLVAAVTPVDAADKSVSWSTADAAIATVADGTVTGVAAGSVYVYVTTTDGGFMDSCMVTVSIVEGINSRESGGVKVYPNPVDNGVLYIQLADNSLVNSIEIYNTIGVLVHREAVNSRNLIDINTSGMLEKGIYFVKFAESNSTYIERIIVQ